MSRVAGAWESGTSYFEVGCCCDTGCEGASNIEQVLALAVTRGRRVAQASDWRSRIVTVLPDLAGMEELRWLCI